MPIWQWGVLDLKGCMCFREVTVLTLTLTAMPIWQWGVLDLKGCLCFRKVTAQTQTAMLIWQWGLLDLKVCLCFRKVTVLALADSNADLAVGFVGSESVPVF